ncbi:hypothetical protein APHAL10511_005259 [Amanita phalloides]|nr:hypothetical protein APHAL10511_005259 [Amanita phalloides]
MPSPLMHYGYKSTLIIETKFNDILISQSNPSTQLCANETFPSKNEDLTVILSKMPYTSDYSYALKFPIVTFYACRTAMIRNCGKPACIATMDRLKSVIPPCTTWPGLEQWVLQAAACWCYGKSTNLGLTIQRVCSLVMKVVVLPTGKSTADVYTRKRATITDWARQVNHREVIPLLSWLSGLFLGKYKDPWMDIQHNPLITVFMDRYHDTAIVQAISRVRKLHLCPHRVWAIAFSMPGIESTIPALVPHKHPPCTYKHDYCSTGLSHRNCTYDYCQISAVNFTNVVQCHRPNCDEKCQEKVFPAHLLDQAASKNRPTAWTIDGELRLIESGERYMAISHVWSDGTGGSGRVNKCMYDFFCDVARKLKCKGMWWDAICIPRDKRARAKAISHMHEYYSQAACTIVHDACLAMSEWVDSEHASFALVMSNWFTRGWTALELSRSKQVKVLFSTNEPPGYVLKDLDVDIVSGRAVVSSLSRQVASTAISSLREKNSHRLTLDGVLTALGPKFTSWVHDRAIIAGQFVGIENLADDQYSIYQQIVCKIGKISADQLFHHAASPTGPFAWLPSNLFDLPVSRYHASHIKVFKDGGLLGTWGIILLSLNFHFFWDMMHPMSRYCVRAALDDDRHIILFHEYEKRPITRGLVVKVMKDIGPSRNIPGGCDIRCHYVGPVYFAPLSLSQAALRDVGPYHSVLIDDSGANLDTGVSAVDHIRSLISRKSKVFTFRRGLLELA